MHEMNINPQSEIQQIEKIRGYRKSVEIKKDAAEKPGDEVSISDRGKILSAIARLPDIRSEKIEMIKQKVKDGTYLTDEKIKAALKNLISDI